MCVCRVLSPVVGVPPRSGQNGNTFADALTRALVTVSLSLCVCVFRVLTFFFVTQAKPAFQRFVFPNKTFVDAEDLQAFAVDGEGVAQFEDEKKKKKNDDELGELLEIMGGLYDKTPGVCWCVMVLDCLCVCS